MNGHFYGFGREQFRETPIPLGEVGEGLRRGLLDLFSVKKSVAEIARAEALDLLTQRPRRRQVEPKTPSIEQPATIPVEPGVYRRLQDSNDLNALILTIYTISAALGNDEGSQADLRRLFDIVSPHLWHLVEYGHGEMIVESMLRNQYSLQTSILIEHISVTLRSIMGKLSNPGISHRKQSIINIIILAVERRLITVENKEELRKWLTTLGRIPHDDAGYSIPPDPMDQLYTTLNAEGVFTWNDRIA